MNAIAEPIAAATEIVALVGANPVMVLTDRAKFNQFYEAMRKEADALVPDVSTEKGRKAIASLAHKVARTKTAIDDAGKQLNEEARSRINAIDESRREIRQQLDALKAEVRKPLTEWEDAEADRVEKAAAELAKLREAGRVEFEDTAETVAARIQELSGMTLDPALHGDTLGIAEAARVDAIQALGAARERLAREEAERAELERLRSEAVERERQEQAAREAQEIERRRVEAEAAEQARLDVITKEAEERAKAEAERKAQEEREAAERAHAEALAAERKRTEEAEAAAQAERDRILRQETERREAEERAAAEQARRDADLAHRSTVMRAAKEAIMEAGSIDEAAAKSIVLAIAAGNVPSISIRF